MRPLNVNLVNTGHNKRFSLSKKAICKTKDPKKTFILFEIDGNLFLKFPVYAEYQKMYFGVPSEFVNRESLKIIIHGIYSENELLQRENNLLKIANNRMYINMKSFLPKEIEAKRGKNKVKLYVIEKNGKLFIFPKLFIVQKSPVISNKYFTLEDLAAIHGFYFCEGRKSHMFRIANSEKKVMDRFLEVLYRNFNINDFTTYCILNYVVDGENDKSEEELNEWWNPILRKRGLKINLFRFLGTKAKFYAHRKAEYGSLTFCVINTSFFDVIMGILKSSKILRLMSNINFAWELLRWVAAGDMYPRIHNRRLSRLGIAAEEHEINFYHKLTNSCGFKRMSLSRVSGTKRGYEILFSGLDNFINAIVHDTFRYILYRKRKLERGFLRIPAIRYFLKNYDDLKSGMEPHIFAKKNKLKVGLAIQLLRRYNKLNLVKKLNDSYFLADFGKYLIDTLR